MGANVFRYPGLGATHSECSRRCWTPVGVSGGTTAFAGAAAVAGADTTGEPHAPASNTTVALSATRNGHAERPDLLSLEPSFMVSSLPRGGPSDEGHGPYIGHDETPWS